MPLPFSPFLLPPLLLLLLLLLATLLPPAHADINQLQLIGTYRKIPVPPFSASCPDGVRILQVDPISTNEGVFFVITHNNIQLPLTGGGFQTCITTPVSAPRFGDTSATVLQRDSQSFIDRSNPLVNAFAVAQETFFLGRELGPRTCGQAILPADSVSIWVAPEVVINVPAGDYAINFKPGFKYVYYFSETDPCLFRGNANQKGTLRPVATPPSPTPTPVSQLLSPVPVASRSPLASPVGNNVVPPAGVDDGVIIIDGVPDTSAPACFPYDAVVETTRGVMAMGQVRVGDQVLVDRGRYSPVFGFTHAARAERAEFVVVSTRKRTLTLSQGHYMYANGRAVQARLVRVGDVVTDVEDGEAVVTRVGTVRKTGLYNAQTVDGNIVVDGIIVTTYTTALWEMMTAHALLTPVRVLRYLVPVDGLLERIRLWWLVYRDCLLL